MQIYTYACSDCGSFDLMRPMARRDEPASCPSCEQAGRRVFTAPHLGRLDPALDRAVTSAGRSSESPGVTRSIPAAAGPPSPPPRRPDLPPLPRL